MRRRVREPGYFSSDAWPGAEPWWGATATGLPLLGGLITIDELERGRIDHALAMAIPDARAGVWAQPAHPRRRRQHRPELPARGSPPAARSGPRPRPPRTPAADRDVGGRRTALRNRGPRPSPGSSLSTARIRRRPGADAWADAYQRQAEPDRLLERFPWQHLEVLTLELEPRSDDELAGQEKAPR